MCKKFLGIIIVTAITTAVKWNISPNGNEVGLSDLTLGNVEALASGEVGTACCPSPGHTCRSSSGVVLRDYEDC